VPSKTVDEALFVFMYGQMSNFYMGLASVSTPNGSTSTTKWPKPATATTTTPHAPINPDDLRMGDHIRVRTVEDITAFANAGGSRSSSPTAPTTSIGESKSGIITGPVQPPHVAFLGFPYDEGCARNNGRIGASDGPANVRKLMQRMGTLVNPEHHVDLRTIQMSDVGDIKAGTLLIC
jgi:hypothetical protein